MDRWTRRWTPRTRRRRPSRWSAHGLVFEQLDFGQSSTVMLINAPQRKAGLWPTPLGHQSPATGPWRWLYLSPAWTPADARLLLSKTIIHPISPINATAHLWSQKLYHRSTLQVSPSSLRSLVPPAARKLPRRGPPATSVAPCSIAPALSCCRRPASRSWPYMYRAGATRLGAASCLRRALIAHAPFKVPDREGRRHRCGVVHQRADAADMCLLHGQPSRGTVAAGRG